MGRPRSERGAVLPIVALMLAAILGIAAFAVDLGMQRVARRDMQALADAVALDVARLLDGRTAHEVESGDATNQSLAAALAESADRNDDHTLGEPPTVSAVLVEVDAAEAVVYAGGVPKDVADGDVPDAVLVTATTAVDFGFADGEGGATRTALGTAASVGCFRLGSYALAVDALNGADTGSARIDALLEDALQVNGLGYHGLADAKVSLAGLATELGAATPDQLAAVQGVTLRNLFSLTADVLDAEGGSSADVTLLRDLAGSAASELDAAVDVADLLTLSSGSTAVLASQVWVLDLVAAAAFASDGTHALSVPILWSVPKFSSGPVSLEIIERPQQACGEVGPATTAATAQLEFLAQPKLNVPTIAGLAGSAVGVSLDVRLAGADGVLTGLECGDGTVASPEGTTASVTRQLDTVALSIPIQLSGEIKASDLGLNPALFGLLSFLSGTKATVSFTVQAGTTAVSAASSQPGVTYWVPTPHDYSDPEQVGGTDPLALPSVTLDASDFSGTVTVGAVTRNLASLNLVTDINLSAVISELNTKVVSSAINPFIANVNDVLTPTSDLLGLSLNGADLYGVPSPSCDNPALRG